MGLATWCIRRVTRGVDLSLVYQRLIAAFPRRQYSNILMRISSVLHLPHKALTEDLGVGYACGGDACNAVQYGRAVQKIA